MIERTPLAKSTWGRLAVVEATPTHTHGHGKSPHRFAYTGPNGVRLFVLLATAGVLAAWIPALLHRSFDPDEFEHSHAAWCVFRGMVPYRDFFEHHTPWYYYVLLPLFHAFDVSGSVGSAKHFLLCGRVLSLGLTVVSVLLVSRIGRLWERRDVGLWAGLLLVAQPMFFEKSIEIRPDVLALPGLAGCLWLLLRGLAKCRDARIAGRWYFFAGGASLGAAIMCTQKMLFVLPGLLLGLAIWTLAAGKTAASDASSGTGPRFRILLTLMFLAGLSVPIGLTWAAFALHHAGNELITNNFVLNAKWKPIETYQIYRLIFTSWPMLVLGLLGGALSLARCFRSAVRPWGELLLLCTLVGLFAGLWVIPSAHGQYYLMALPLVCLFAAQALLWLVARVRDRARPALLVLALSPLAVLPARGLRDSFRPRNDGQLARLEYVFAHTEPDDLVMDGWQGTGVFRPHAFYYFFLHSETLAMLPRPQLAAYLTALELGKIQPRLIAMDWNLRTLGPRFESFVRSHYFTNDGFLYFRRGLQRSPPGSLLRRIRAF